MLSATNVLTRLQLSTKIAVPTALALAALAAALSIAPIAQDPAYHGFADTRAWLGVANVADVASNLGYLVAGTLGLRFLASGDGRALFAARWQALPWQVFFTGVVLVAAGSAWYHLAPGNATLLWDRLAMSIAFMALFAAFVADRVDARFGAFVVLPTLLALGAASVFYWYATETAGRGDLRFFFLLNPVWPALTLPLICALFPGRNTRAVYLFYILLWYGGAIACEQLDHEIFAATGGLVGGHAIKHLLSAGAVVSVLAMLRRAARNADPTVPI